MMWQPTQDGGYWFGPLKVVTQEDRHAVWATQGGKLHRRAPEHVRPVCSQEARQIQHEVIPNSTGPTDNIISQPHTPNPIEDNENIPSNPPTNENTTDNSDQNIPSNNSSASQDQPDNEPGITTPPDDNSVQFNDPAVETPIPDNLTDDDLVTAHILCCEDEIMVVDPLDIPCAWRCELELPSNVSQEQAESWSADEILLATADKRQRTEVKLSTLNAEEQRAFQTAKETEIRNWLKTGTVY